MDEDRKNCVIIDWLSFSHKLLTVDEMIAVLGLSGESWVDEEHSKLRYERRKIFLHITVHYTPVRYVPGSICQTVPSTIYNPGVCVEFSGQGCREFEEFSSVGWSDLLTWIHDESSNEVKCAMPAEGLPFPDVVMQISVPRSCKVCQISRLDLAYDDFDGVLNINTLAECTRLHNYTSLLSKHSIIEDSEINNPDHTGISVCFGSRSSNVFFRFYDKRVERAAWDLEHWVRAEIQLRSAAAVGALDCLCSGMPCGELHSNICYRYLNFRDPGSDSHKDRWHICQWWLDFLESVVSIALFSRKDVEYNKNRMDNYAYKQNHNHTLTELACDGIGAYLLRLLEFREQIPEKYLKVAQMCSRNGAELAELLAQLPTMSKADFLLFFAQQLDQAAKEEADAAEYRRIFGFIDL